MQDLTIQDTTQRAILSHLSITEQLLARAASEASGVEQSAQIWAMPDLGMPNNISRIHGGFFTGALYSWHTLTPLVPIDATVNCCGVSVFRVGSDIPKKAQFDQLIQCAINRTQRDGSYNWNFSSGNHFVTYGEVTGSDVLPDGRYVVLHSSASEFKRQDNGLYPVAGNWYSDKIKTIRDTRTNRYIRYIEGRTAERFISLAQLLEGFNKLRHQYFAGLIFGEQNIEDEILNIQHYGMPTPNSVAIGCQWLSSTPLLLLLTAPERPLFFIKPTPAYQNQVTLEGNNLSLYPHGLGKEVVGSVDIQYYLDDLSINGERFGLHETLKGQIGFRIRNFLASEAQATGIPKLVQDVLAKCPGEVIAKLQPIHSYCCA